MVDLMWSLWRYTCFGLAAMVVSTASRSVMAADLGTSEPLAVEDPTHPFFRHRVILQAGAAFNQLSSTVQVGRAGVSSGTEISLEDDLRFSSAKSSPDALARLRLGDSWNLEFSYFDASRSKSAGIQRTIEFGRLDFPASASVDAQFGISAYRLALGYAFHRTRTSELGVSFGLHINDFSAKMSGAANVGGLAAGFQTEEYSVVAPLPTIGLFAHHALTSRWLVSGRLDWMDVSLDSIKVGGIDLRNAGGSILSVELATEYRLLDHLAIGAAYRYQDVGFGATVSGLRGEIAYTASAPIVFVRTSF